MSLLDILMRLGDFIKPVALIDHRFDMPLLDQGFDECQVRFLIRHWCPPLLERINGAQIGIRLVPNCMILLRKIR